MKSKISSERFAVRTLRCQNASLSERKSKDLLSEGLCPLVFGGGRVLNERVGVL